MAAQYIIKERKARFRCVILPGAQFLVGNRTTRPKDNSPKDNSPQDDSPQDDSPHIQKTTRPTFKRQLAPHRINAYPVKYDGHAYAIQYVTITNDLKWNTHIRNISTKANITLSFLRRTLFSCPQKVKEAAYKGMVRPILEYESSVSDPRTNKLQEELEKVQNRAERFVTRNYVYETGSMTGILGQLKWESRMKRIKDIRLILLYKGLKDKF